MSRTHDVTISAFDLDRLEKSAEAWQSVAHRLAAALEASQPRATSHPAVFLHHSPDRTAALESYARLKTATHSHLQAPDSTLPYEL